MSNRKKIIISIFSLLTCVLVTFAWINELINPRGRYLTLRLENSAVASSDLEVRLSVNVEDELYEDITSIRNEESEPDLDTFENFAPGSRKKFRLDIANLSEASVNLRLILTDIICDHQELRECIIIGTNGFAGFTDDYPAPSVQTQSLAVGMDASSSFVLLDHVEIPPDNKDNPVSIYFYVMFAAAGSEQLEDTSFAIQTINLLTI